MTSSPPDEHFPQTPADSPLPLALRLAWALLVATLGGFLCALVIDWVGEIGSISLWGLGAIAGMVSWKIASRRSALVGWSLAAAMIVALLVAETFWIYWHPKQTYLRGIEQSESLWSAIKWLPTFFKEYKVAGFIGGIMTAFGAYSAYRQNA